MSSDIPSGWTKTTVGEIGRYLNGRGFKKSEWSTEGRPIIRIQDLTGSGSGHNYFEGDVEERHVVRAGDLLMSWAATLDAFIWNGPEAVLNQHIFKVETKIDRRFHYYLLKRILPELYRSAHGSGMVHVTKSTFESFPIAIPSDEEQAAIVEEIEKHSTRLDSGVRSLRRIELNVRRYRRVLLETAVQGRLTGGSDPESWPIVTVEDVAKVFEYGSSAKAQPDIDGVPMLRMGNIDLKGRIQIRELKYLPPEHPDVSRYQLMPGDLLFNRTNSPEQVGKTAVYRGEPQRCLFASYLIRVRLRDDCAPEYLSYVTNSAFGRRWVKSVVSQQVGQANVSGGKYKQFAFRLPPRDYQDVLIEAVEDKLSIVDEVLVEVSKQLLRSQSLRRSILARAFSGALISEMGTVVA